MKGDAKHSDMQAGSRAERLAEELRANLGKRRAQARARKKSEPGKTDASATTDPERDDPPASER